MLIEMILFMMIESLFDDRDDVFDMIILLMMLFLLIDKMMMILNTY